MDPLTSAEARELDRRAQDEYGLAGLVLMENAGAGAARALLCAAQAELERAGSEVLVLCGAGNNAGDGYVLARHVHNAGRALALVAAADPERLPPDALANARVCAAIHARARAGGAAFDWIDARGAQGLARALERIARAAVVVEALVGTGARGALRAPYDALVRAANASPALRFALDLPAGLDADTGEVREPAFRAHVTATFAAPKPGLASAEGRRCAGRVEVVDIGVPPELARAVRRRGL